MNARSYFRHAAVVASLVFISACGYLGGARTGKVTGPVGGAVTGSEIFGEDPELAVTGHLLGQVNGDRVYQALNEKDLKLMSSLALTTLNHGADNKIETWRNGRSRHHGSFVASSTWGTSDRIECRRFINIIYVDETESRASGTACRQRDGTWAIMG